MKQEFRSIFITPLIQLINSLVSPTIITVIVTAIAGPLVVQSILERVETKKRQAEVITQVLTIFDKADFSNDLTVGKLELISTLVDENKHVYDLEFNETLKKLKEENQRIIEKIKKQLIEKNNDIKKTQNEINDKIQNITALNSEINDLKIRKAEINQNDQEARLQLQEQLKAKENELNQSKRELGDLHNSLKNEQDNKRALQASLDITKEDLNKVTEEKKLLEKRLENETTFLSTQLALANVKVRQQRDEITRLQHENEILKSSSPVITTPTQEISPQQDVPTPP